MSLELSIREKVILKLVALGYSDKQIAIKLSLAKGTVKNHLQLAYTKLRVNNRTLAVIKAYRKGEIDLEGVS